MPHLHNVKPMSSLYNYVVSAMQTCHDFPGRVYMHISRGQHVYVLRMSWLQRVCMCLYVCVFLSVLLLPHSTANKFPTSLLTALTHTPPPLSSTRPPSPLLPSFHPDEYSILFIFGQFWGLCKLSHAHTRTHMRHSTETVANYSCWLATSIHELEKWSNA